MKFRILRRRRPRVAVVRLSGRIGAPSGPFSRTLSLVGLERTLRSAFRKGRKSPQAVSLIVNSPGGSPSQTALLAERIRQLADDSSLRVFAFAEDMALSGGYWLLCAGDRMIAERNSLVGSVGVIHAGFGFSELLGKIGAERRIQTVGEDKAMLDPFSPLNPRHVDRLSAIQRDAADSFAEVVRERRGASLVAEESEWRSGAFWSGKQAKDMGLVDDVGTFHDVMRREFGDDVEAYDAAPKRKGLMSLMASRESMESSVASMASMASGASFGGSFRDSDVGSLVEGVVSAAEDRLLRDRLGL